MRYFLSILIVALDFFIAIAQCDPTIKVAEKNFLSYQKRENRCEGFYTPPTSGPASIYLISFLLPSCFILFIIAKSAGLSER